MSKKTSIRDYSDVLIVAAILVTVIRYAGAFYASDVGNVTGAMSDILSFLMGFTGLGMGLLDVLGGAYIFDGWRRKMPAQGQKWGTKFTVLTMFVFGLILTGVFILVPFTVSRTRHEGISTVLGDLDWAWSIAINIAPYLLIGGVVVGNAGVVGVETSEKVDPKLGESSDNDTPEVDQKKKPTSEKRKKYAELTDGELAELAKMATGKIQAKYKISDTAARQWRKWAQEWASKVNA